MPSFEAFKEYLVQDLESSRPVKDGNLYRDGINAGIDRAVSRIKAHQSLDAGQVGVVGHGDGQYITLGHIAAELRRMQRDGMTREAINYAMDRVFIEEDFTPQDLLKTVYTVRRSPYTAAAKTSAGYNSVDMEYTANSAAEALEMAIKDCTWQDPTRNFRFHAISSRVTQVVK